MSNTISNRLADLQIETLEDRMMLSTVQVIASGDTGQGRSVRSGSTFLGIGWRDAQRVR